MGADGRIVDTNKAVLAEMTCHECGGHIDRLVPWRGHEACLQSDDSLMVNLHLENYEER